MEVSLGSLRQHHLVQSQIGNRAAEASVLGLQFLRMLHLAIFQAVVFCAPAAICNVRHICSAIDLPCAFSTSTWRNFVTISSALCLFTAISMSFFGSIAATNLDFERHHARSCGVEETSDPLGSGYRVTATVLRTVVARESRGRRRKERRPFAGNCPGLDQGHSAKS